MFEARYVNPNYFYESMDLLMRMNFEISRNSSDIFMQLEMARNELRIETEHFYQLCRKLDHEDTLNEGEYNSLHQERDRVWKRIITLEDQILTLSRRPILENSDSRYHELLRDHLENRARYSTVQINNDMFRAPHMMREENRLEERDIVENRLREAESHIRFVEGERDRLNDRIRQLEE